MKKIVYLPLLALVVTGISGCSDDASEAKRKLREHQVVTFTVVKEPLVSEQELSGVLEPIRRIQVLSETKGKILELAVQAGDKVTENQLLVKLDDSIIRAQYRKAKASTKQARLILKRLQTLKKKNLASEEAITQARTNLEVALAEERLQLVQLQQTAIVAPFSGYISERVKEPGDVVSEHTQILTLIDKSALKARIPVSEYLLPTLNKDYPVSLRIEAIGSQTLPAKITRIYPAIDTTTHQGTIEVELNPAPENARPGQFIRVSLKAKTTPRLNVPLIAVKQDFASQYVYRIKNNKSQRVDVQTGIQLENRIEIISGLDEGDEIITRGFVGLRAGKPVKIINTQSETSLTTN